MPEKQIYIITGGPGFGKTELVAELERKGYLCSGEYARELINEQQKIGGQILPWKNSRLFQLEILSKRIAFFESVPELSPAFADRGIPDQIAFSRYRGFGTPEILIESSQKYRYAPKVFLTPPWHQVYRNDSIRTESFEEAMSIHEIIKMTYQELKYETIELPLGSIHERIEFILKTI